MKVSEIMKKRLWIIKILMVILLCSKSLLSLAQLPTDTLPPDPGAISVYTVQNMSFGAFAHQNVGGTVTISNSGSRSSTGDIVPLNYGYTYFQCIFEIEGPVGTIISIMNGPDATLTGSNGGSISLHLGNSNPASPFSTTVSPPARTQVNIGGTITIGNNSVSPPGAYTGSFYITFNQQ